MITNKQRRDYQRSAVYTWGENYVIPADLECLDIVTCNLLCQDVLKGFKIDRQIPIKPFVSRTMRGVYHADSSIRLTDRGQIRPIVLHEIAHALTRYYYGYSVPSHGQEYVSFFMLLLAKYSRIPLTELMRTAILSGVEFCDPKLMFGFQKNFRPQSWLRNKERIIKLVDFVPDNVIVSMVPGKRGGFDIEWLQYA